MLNSFSERLRLCRAMTGLSATFIVKQINKGGFAFSNRQFSRWEVGNIDTGRILKHDVVECIVDIFNASGLPELSAEWLLHGRGIPPFLVDMSHALEEEKAFYISRAMGSDYKLTTIASNYSEPFASPGDQIITRASKPEKVENKIVFIQTHSHKLYLGILSNNEENIVINNIDRKNSIKKSDIAYCGKLTWIS